MLKGSYGGSPPPGIATGGPAGQLLPDRYALIVGFVAEDRHPYATRGWGLTLLPGQPSQVRLVLGEDDGPHLEEGGRIALTAGDPRTLRAVQLKGRAEPVEPATDDDRAAASHFCEAFFGVVQEVEGTERSLLERMVPNDFVACTVVIDEMYNQTPGPGAGGALGTGST